MLRRIFQMWEDGRGGKAVKGLQVKGLKVNGFAHLPQGRRRRGLRQ
jgi:hypothetical protein